MTDSQPARAALPTLFVLLALAVASCDTAPDTAGGATAGLTASLLESSPPPAPATQEQAMDLATLGFDAGTAGAPLQVVEFSDFGCGYCARFHAEVFPSLEREFIQTGKVEWKYIPMILGMFGPNAELAAHVGECAGEQGHFPTMRDRLFAHQSEWKRAAEPRPAFDELARAEGLDMDRYQRCVDEEWRAERIAGGTQLSRQAGVRGTPTFFVVGYGSIPGMLPLDVFRQVLDTAYAERTRAGG